MIDRTELVKALNLVIDHAGNMADDTAQNVRERDWWDSTAHGLTREAHRLEAGSRVELDERVKKLISDFAAQGLRITVNVNGEVGAPF